MWTLRATLGRLLLAARQACVWARPPRRLPDAHAHALRKRRIEAALMAEGLSRSAARRLLRVVDEEYCDAER
ncbi:hypothetical protein ACNQFN_10975 [Thauera butanivorans]|uniref:hypothetical protein n=1 Tax=Thauera butanivorans TaxID=86174 RepID=UPI003AB7FB02